MDYGLCWLYTRRSEKIMYTGVEILSGKSIIEDSHMVYKKLWALWMLLWSLINIVNGTTYCKKDLSQKNRLYSEFMRVEMKYWESVCIKIIWSWMAVVCVGN